MKGERASDVSLLRSSHGRDELLRLGLQARGVGMIAERLLRGAKKEFKISQQRSQSARGTACQLWESA